MPAGRTVQAKAVGLNLQHKKPGHGRTVPKKWAYLPLWEPSPKMARVHHRKIKAAVQLGPTAPVEFHVGSPPAKFAHLVCGSQWAQKSLRLHCPNLPLVAYGEVLHHSYHGGNKLA